MTMDRDNKTATVTFTSDSGPTGPPGCCGTNSVKAYISARNTVVTDGNSTVVNWSSDNATSCEQKEGGSDTGWVSASDATSGNYTTDNFTTSGGARTYTINCSNGSQTADASVTVSVGSDYTGTPSVNMWADPQSIGYKKHPRYNGLAVILWQISAMFFILQLILMNGYLTWRIGPACLLAMVIIILASDQTIRQDKQPASLLLIQLIKFSVRDMDQAIPQ